MRCSDLTDDEILDILIDIIWDSPGEPGGDEPPF